MMQPKPNLDPYDVALVTVAVPGETGEQIAAAISKMPWAMTASHWDSYFSRGRRPQLPPTVMNADRSIAVIDFDRDSDLAVETADYLNQAFSERIALVALSSQSDPDLMLRAMRAGCNEFLRTPFDTTQFAASLARLDNKWSNASSRTHSSGQVLSFFGAKGGVGTTTLTIQLAISLVRLHAKKVLLIDNHLQFGHVCLYLGLEGAHYYFHELVRSVDRLDSELLRGFVANHPVGMDVLASPDTIGAIRSIDSDSLVRTIEFLRGEYDYILLDCAALFDEDSLTLIDASDRCYLVATPDIGAVRNLSRYLDNLTRNEQRSSKAHIVINRCSSEGAVDIRQIEKAIRRPIAIKLPNSYPEMIRAVNVGEPLSATKKSELASQLTRWANEIVGTKASDPPRRSASRIALW